MKKISFYTCFFAAGILLFTACKKETKMNATYESATDQTAYLRVIHASPNFRQVFNAPDSFNVYVNNVKMNAPFLTYGSIFPAATTGNGYVAVAPGQQQVKISVNGFASASPDSTQILTLSKTFGAGEYYTLFISDSLKSNPNASFVPDLFTKPLNGNAGIRFMHAVLNDTAGKSVDVYSYARNATVFTNLLPGQVSPIVSLGVNVGVADTFYVTRSAPAGTLLANRIVLAKLALAAANQRNYSLYFRGDANLTTGTRARTLSVYLHQ